MCIRDRLKTALNKLTGVSPEMLIDKLGERLAFERTGVRLYEALLAKASVVGVVDDTQDVYKRQWCNPAMGGKKWIFHI